MLAACEGPLSAATALTQNRLVVVITHFPTAAAACLFPAVAGGHAAAAYLFLAVGHTAAACLCHAVACGHAAAACLFLAVACLFLAIARGHPAAA